MAHSCHVPGCGTGCAPKYLTCGPHWRMVPLSMQAEVYRTLSMRGKLIDSSWAPWWRAQANAIHAIMVAEGRDKAACDRWLARELETAVKLEERA